MWIIALLLTSYNILDEKRASAIVGTTLDNIEIYIAENGDINNSEIEYPDYLFYPEMEMPVVDVDGQLYIGTLLIPSLDVELPIISSWDYEKLKIAPCRYAGSAYTDTLVIAAHNYRSHFGQLGKLAIDDLLTFTDADGNSFQYEVVDIEMLSPMSVEDMVSGNWDLTLFTCTVGGQKRLTVRCARI